MKSSSAAARPRLGRCLLIAAVVLALSCGVALAQRKGEKTWEVREKLAISNLELGSAVFKDNEWHFQGDGHTFSTKGSEKKLTLMVRFAYESARAEEPLKFIIKLPESRLYEEDVVLPEKKGQYVYRFTVHRPEDFMGSGSVYLYHGFTFVEVINFTITGNSG